MSKMEKRQIAVVLGCVLRQVTRTHGVTDQGEGSLAPQVLLVRRREAEQKEIHLMWELPGGKVDFGETAEEAVVREVKEETDYEARVVKPLPFSYATEWKYEDFIQHTIIFCYECAIINNCSDPTVEDSKVKEVKWFRFDEIDYSRVIPGSRDFILHVAEEHGVQLEGFEPQIAYANFTRIDKSNNIQRSYEISLRIHRSAKEYRYVVTTRPKRRGTRGMGKVYVYTFKTDKAARNEIRKRLKDRLQHGYYLAWCSDNFPLKELLEQFPRLTKKEYIQMRLFD